ncbi:MAG TPA: chloride channel protein [Ignavibacteria bacterium]|nr:chloride channel protein [Ignavibacteria bacterium]HMR39319.1 chloride channel protein [Ignavibacteria bacterium]
MDFIRLIREKLISILDSKSFKKNFLNALPFWIGAIITGLLSVFYAKLFSWAEDGTSYIFEKEKWLFFIITPLTFILAWWVVKKYSPYSKGSGIPQVVAAIELSNTKEKSKVDKLLGVKVIFVKMASSLIMIFGGGAIGREGPTIQISASIFKKINDLLPEWYPKISTRTMLVTGAAAGLASAFNTPLGGIVFAIEELTRTHFSFFKSALLTGVIIAGLTALNLLGPYLYLGYPLINDTSLWMVLIVIPVSVVTGLAGSGMGKAILYISEKKKDLRNNKQKLFYTMVCGLILASMAVIIDARAFGSGKEIMVATLFTDQKYLEWYIPLLRIIGPVISFTSGAAGGIFAPSLSAGASIGALISGWMELSGTDTNLVILCGMVGFLTGITKSPFTSSILVIEMTNNHNIIFNLMLTAVIANLVSNFVSRHSFYDQLKDQYLEDLHKSDLPVKKKIKVPL